MLYFIIAPEVLLILLLLLLLLCHLPYAYFTMSEQHPHFIFHNFKTIF